MDGYKKQLITLVEERAALWNPKHEDYKSKEERRLIWEEIDGILAQTKLSTLRQRPLKFSSDPEDYGNQARSGSPLTAKEMWDQLTRGYANAIRRKQKRAFSGICVDMEWKFEKQMEFLLPVKQMRHHPGTAVPKVETGAYSQEEIPSDSGTYEDSEDADIVLEEVESLNDHDIIIGSTITTRNSQKRKEIERDSDYEDGYSGSRTILSSTIREREQLHKKRRKERDNSDEFDSNKTLLSILREQHIQKSTESERLNFFKSMMSVVDSFDDDLFMNFQLDVIHAAQKHKRLRTTISEREQLYKKRRKERDNSDDVDSNTTLLSILREQHIQKSTESACLNFFRSLMSVVDSFDDDQFMNFQLDVIHTAQKHKRLRSVKEPSEHSAAHSSNSNSHHHTGHLSSIPLKLDVEEENSISDTDKKTMPGATAAVNPILAGIEDVFIDDKGRFKYILCKVYIESNPDEAKMIIRGTARAGYHADIYDHLDASLEDQGVVCECLGGGKIDHDSEAKHITVFGISQGYGKADHSIAVKLLKQKYTDYECITETDFF